MNCRRLALLIAIIAVCALSAPHPTGDGNGPVSNGGQPSGGNQGPAVGTGATTKSPTTKAPTTTKTTTPQAAPPLTQPHPTPPTNGSNIDSNSTRPTTTPTRGTTKTTAAGANRTATTTTPTAGTNTTAGTANETTTTSTTARTNTTTTIETNSTATTNSSTMTTTTRTRATSKATKRTRPTPAPVVHSMSAGEVISYVLVGLMVVGGVSALLFAYFRCFRHRNTPAANYTAGTAPNNPAPLKTTLAGTASADRVSTGHRPTGHAPATKNKTEEGSPGPWQTKYEDKPDLTGPEHLDVNKIRFRGPMKIPNIIVPISADEDDSKIPDLLPNEHFEIDENLNEAIEIGSEVESVVDLQGNVVRPPRPPAPSPPRRNRADGNPNQLQVIRD
ncbi:unnamed protein product [Bursaphelenchus xylophilus]|uniref:(pine wood nematode) hypothetical protein n=1 Tax=Bursaphelenchus xylophilus TaxID=6326 RepID=A0A1I7S647_BURXY|nr:unnamed protein product [Bursaphelenchus xylophilus]CAG9082264.1 unnamed protein product [Bursaphelenchus xylophilus]